LMSPKNGLRITLALLGGGTAWAQIGAPSLGFLPDSGRLRPVYGIPSAAMIAGPLDTGPLDTGHRFVDLAVAPRQDYALAIEAESREVFLLQPGLGVSKIAGVDANPARLVFSPGGSAAALWSSSTNRTQILTGLPG